VAAPKKRYGSTRNRGQSELQKAEEVQESLEGLWEWIRKYRYILGGSLMLLCVVAIGYSFWDSQVEDELKEESAAFGQAMNTYDGVVGESLPDQPADFATEKAKYTAALERLQAFEVSHVGSILEPLAKLAEGPAHYALEDWDKDIAAVQGYLDSNADSSFSPVLYQQLGLAEKRAGRADSAAGHFQKMTESSDWWFQATGYIHLGDLHNGGLGSSAPESDAARKHYQAARSIAEQEADENMTRMIDTRIALLN
jgi:predicted negative regulator of RcsB-dependent stress response